MLSQAQIDQFAQQGYLVVEDLLTPEVLAAVRAEYAALMDNLYQSWFDQGLVSKAPDSMEFWDKLEVAYRGGFEWYQPFDISLPHGGITDQTPMHFGPAVFDMVTSQRILDTVECLIGPVIHARGDHAYSAGVQLGRSAPYRAVALHVVHVAVKTLIEPLQQPRFSRFHQCVGNAKLLKSQLFRPCSNAISQLR